MGPKTKELVEILGRLIELLEEDGEDQWSAMIRKSRQQLMNSDFSGITALLQMYGGMGSFNDLIIGQDLNDGKFQWKVGAKDRNNQLENLRSKVFEIANEIKRDFDSTSE